MEHLGDELLHFFMQTRLARKKPVLLGLECEALERWMSGLSHTPGKRAWGKTHRGFESRLLRQ